MKEIFRAVRVLGPRRLMRLFRAYRQGWMGTISGFVTTRTMQALVNVGFFDELHAEGRIDVEDFARP